MKIRYFLILLVIMPTSSVVLAGERQGERNHLHSGHDGKSSPPMITRESSRASQWKIQSGYQWRQVGNLSFQTGSRAAASKLPWLAGRGISVAPRSTFATTSSGSDANTGGAGPVGMFANRTYDDGFVNQDGGTATFGDTWFWGYNNAEQLQGDTLIFQATAPGRTTTTTSTRIPGSFTSSSQWSDTRQSEWQEDMSGSGPFIRLETPAIFSTDNFGASVDIGYSWLGTGASNTTDGVFTARQETRTTVGGGGATHTVSVSSTTNQITDSYDTSGIIVPLAPYTGSLGGPDPLINNQPDNRDISSTTSFTTLTSAIPHNVESFRGTATFASRVDESLDVDLHTISLGPQLWWEIDRVRLGLSPGCALNIVQFDARYREDLYARVDGGSTRRIASWEEKSSGTRLQPGVYVEASAAYAINDWLGVFAAGRYDWAGTMSGDVGPSRYALDFSGWTASVGIEISF